jgi:hypothetical protein
MLYVEFVWGLWGARQGMLVVMMKGRCESTPWPRSSSRPSCQTVKILP